MSRVHLADGWYAARLPDGSCQIDWPKGLAPRICFYPGIVLTPMDLKIINDLMGP